MKKASILALTALLAGILSLGSASAAPTNATEVMKSEVMKMKNTAIQELTNDSRVFAKDPSIQVRSAHVNAPVIKEFPVAMECELLEIVDTENLHCVIGKIVGVSADEKVLDSKGKVDPAKLNAFAFDQFQSGYYKIGEKVGQAWNAGAGLMKK